MKKLIALILGMLIVISCTVTGFAAAEKNDDTKYPYVCHAELNAILNNGGRNLNGCKIYVALFPCNECAKAIIQSGIKEVLYISDKYKDTVGNRVSRRMFDAAGVKYTKIKLSRDELKVSFREEDI